MASVRERAEATVMGWRGGLSWQVLGEGQTEDLVAAVEAAIEAERQAQVERARREERERCIAAVERLEALAATSGNPQGDPWFTRGIEHGLEWAIDELRKLGEEG